MKRLVLLLLLAPAVFAQHEYIIPLVGSAPGAGSIHYAVPEMLNLTSRTAHIRVTGVYPVGVQHCELDVPAELAPRSRAVMYFQFTCAVHQLAAFTIESDAPLAVQSTIASFVWSNGVGDVQKIDAGTAWIPFAAEAVTYGEFDEHNGLRANLLLINPNAFALRVRIGLTRPEANASREETIVVAPRSTVLHPLRPVPWTLTGEPGPRTGHHEIILAADDRFWAGVSSVTTSGGNHFEKAVPLEP